MYGVGVGLLTNRQYNRFGVPRGQEFCRLHAKSFRREIENLHAMIPNSQRILPMPSTFQRKHCHRINSASPFPYLSSKRQTQVNTLSLQSRQGNEFCSHAYIPYFLVECSYHTAVPKVSCAIPPVILRRQTLSIEVPGLVI